MSQSQSRKRIYLIPAPDMDERAIDSVVIPGFEIIKLNLPPLCSDTNVTACCRSLLTQIEDQEPILLGFCYGGILALELAGSISVTKVVIVASIKQSFEIPNMWKLAALAYYYTPNLFLTVSGIAVTSFVRNVLRSDIKIPRIWLKSPQNKFIVRHALSFQTALDDRLVTHIHGDSDRLLPIKNIKRARVIPGGGHFMFVDKRKEVLTAISESLAHLV